MCHLRCVLYQYGTRRNYYFFSNGLIHLHHHKFVWMYCGWKYGWGESHLLTDLAFKQKRRETMRLTHRQTCTIHICINCTLNHMQRLQAPARANGINLFIWLELIHVRPEVETTTRESRSDLYLDILDQRAFVCWATLCVVFVYMLVGKCLFCLRVLGSLTCNKWMHYNYSFGVWYM